MGTLTSFTSNFLNFLSTLQRWFVQECRLFVQALLQVEFFIVCTALSAAEIGSCLFLLSKPVPFRPLIWPQFMLLWAQGISNSFQGQKICVRAPRSCCISQHNFWEQQKYLSRHVQKMHFRCTLSESSCILKAESYSGNVWKPETQRGWRQLCCRGRRRLYNCSVCIDSCKSFMIQEGHSVS